MNELQLITLATGDYISRPYIQRCVASWERVVGPDRPPIVVDAGMSQSGREYARELGLSIESDGDERVAEALHQRPALREVRDRFLTWKKVVDPVVLGADCTRVLIIDTDVFVAQRVAIPDRCPAFVYQCDDVPAYRGNWRLPLEEPMVYSLNAGFMVITPSEVDLDELETLTRRYFLGYKRPWWTAQSIWSVLMARSGDMGIFDGRDVRTFSGSRKRTLAEAQSNQIKFFGNSALIESQKEALHMIKDLPVVHFAGRGKAWIDMAESLVVDGQVVRNLRVLPSGPADMSQRLMIAARMLITQIRDWYGASAA